MTDPEQGWRRLVEVRSGPVETVIVAAKAEYGKQCEIGPPTGEKWRGEVEMIADALREAGLLVIDLPTRPPQPLDMLDGSTVLGGIMRNVLIRLGHNPDDPKVTAAVRFAVQVLTRTGESHGGVGEPGQRGWENPVRRDAGDSDGGPGESQPAHG